LKVRLTTHDDVAPVAVSINPLLHVLPVVPIAKSLGLLPPRDKLLRVTLPPELLLRVTDSAWLTSPTPILWKSKIGGKKFRPEAAAGEILVMNAFPAEVPSWSWKGFVAPPEEPTTGKFGDVVLPVTKASPVGRSTAMPLPRSAPRPPKYVEYNSAVPVPFTSVTKAFEVARGVRIDCIGS